MSEAFEHTLLVYTDDDGFAAEVAPYLTAGAAAGHALMAVAAGHRIEVLRDSLDPEVAAQVSFTDRDGFYTRPEAALAGYDATVRRLLGTAVPRIRVYGELPRLDRPEEHRSWIRYEAVLNRVFAERPISLLCGYDAGALPADLVDGARRAHPAVAGNGGNPDFEIPEDLLLELEDAPRPAPGLQPIAIDGHTADFRARLATSMRAAGVSEAAGADMQVAVGEVVGNAERHGGGVREIRVGLTPDGFVCEVSDQGAGIDDPLVGYLPPTAAGARGAGLWVSRQFSSRLELLPGADGLTVRLWAAVSPTAQQP
jgi:anti-sigma regulatory factor (Ser/Thr protein kinase)